MHQVKCVNARSIDCRKKFFVNDFFRKCDQILRKLRIRPHLLNKSLMENFIFCAVIHCFEREKSKIFQSLNVTEAENWRKAGNLLYYHQISMKNLHQFDLLYS